MFLKTKISASWTHPSSLPKAPSAITGRKGLLLIPHLLDLPLVSRSSGPGSFIPTFGQQGVADLVAVPVLNAGDETTALWGGGGGVFFPAMLVLGSRACPRDRYISAVTRPGGNSTHSMFSHNCSVSPKAAGS